MIGFKEIVSICEELERENSYIRLTPNKSPSGSSTIYVRIKYGETEWTVRISDHNPPKKSKVGKLSNYIQPTINRKSVKEFLEGRIRKIKRTNIYNVFDSLK